jgi:hypothetical protein
MCATRLLLPSPCKWDDDGGLEGGVCYFLLKGVIFKKKGLLLSFFMVFRSYRKGGGVAEMYFDSKVILTLMPHL